jgi:hypothetical protein
VSVFDVDTDRSGGDDGQRAGVAVADAARPRGRPQRLPLVAGRERLSRLLLSGRRPPRYAGKMFHLPFAAAMFELRVVGSHRIS